LHLSSCFCFTLFSSFQKGGIIINLFIFWYLAYISTFLIWKVRFYSWVKNSKHYMNTRILHIYLSIWLGNGGK
jgi:hypothetical protein